MTKPPSLEEVQEIFARHWASQLAWAHERWEEMEEDDRLAAAVVIFEALKQQTKEATSFRGLIYNRLGFDESCYQPLYCAGGMDLSNVLGDEAPE